jgi:hypothetical protein
VIAADQPIYATTNVTGQNVTVKQVRGLHIDIAVFKSIGSAMEESGGTDALDESSTTTPDFAMMLQMYSQSLPCIHL